MFPTLILEYFALNTSVYLICVVYIARVIYTGNAYQTLPVDATFKTIPRFETSMTLLSISIDTFAFENNKFIS